MQDDYKPDSVMIFKLDTFLKQYKANHIKFEQSKSIAEKFDISMKLMQKVFSLKYYQMPIEAGKS